MDVIKVMFLGVDDNDYYNVYDVGIWWLINAPLSLTSHTASCIFLSIGSGYGV